MLYIEKLVPVPISCSTQWLGFLASSFVIMGWLVFCVDYCVGWVDWKKSTKKYPARKEGTTCLQSQQGFIYFPDLLLCF